MGSPGALLGMGTALGGTVALQGCWAAPTTVISNTEAVSLIQHSKVTLAPFQPSWELLPQGSFSPHEVSMQPISLGVENTPGGTTYQLGVELCN